LLDREFDQRKAIGIVFIKDNASLTLISILANGCNVKEGEIVFIRDEKHTVIFLFKPDLKLHVWGPYLRVVRPISRPFFQAVGVSDLDQTNFLPSEVIFISGDQRVGMTID
jgi:hypothetical protein